MGNSTIDPTSRLVSAVGRIETATDELARLCGSHFHRHPDHCTDNDAKAGEHVAWLVDRALTVARAFADSSGKFPCENIGNNDVCDGCGQCVPESEMG